VAELKPSEDTFISALDQLAKQFDRELARSALETVLLRERARAKFSRAGEMYVTREALEQASGEAIARYRVERFREFHAVGDYCCGIGGDAIALAARGPIVVIDRDPLRLAMAQANLAAYGLGERVEFRLGDVLQMDLPPVAAGFFDPDRRAGGRRQVPLKDYAPPPEALLARLPAEFPLGIKIAPAASWADIQRFDAEAEFISLAGELKECVLWLGPLKRQRRRATLLPGGTVLAADQPAAPRTGPIGEYLYDPDPAVTRAGLVADLAESIGAHQLDAELAFLTSAALIRSPFARAYRIEAALPFQLKRLRAALRQRRVGQVTFLKRGSAIDVEVLRRQLRLAGEEHRVLALTRVAGKPYGLLAAPIATTSPGPA
jgi:hypothetical protein